MYHLHRVLPIIIPTAGGYAAVATAAAIDGLNDGYIHTYTGVGGAPIKLSTEQTKAFGASIFYVTILIFLFFWFDFCISMDD